MGAIEVSAAARVDGGLEAGMFSMSAGAASGKDGIAGRIADATRVWLATGVAGRREATGEGPASFAGTGFGDAWRSGPVAAGVSASRVPDILVGAIASASAERSNACAAGEFSGARLIACRSLSCASSDTAVISNTKGNPVRSIERRGMLDEPPRNMALADSDSSRLPVASVCGGADADGFTGLLPELDMGATPVRTN